MSELELSPGQQTALDAIRFWFDEGDEQVFRMFGPAGTGKTTIARLVPKMLGLDTFYFGAFSGKAANVLRSKGCEPASTLHSLLYGAPINRNHEVKQIEQEVERLEKSLEDPNWVIHIDKAEVLARLDQLATVKRQVLNLIRTDGAFYWPTKAESLLADGAQLLIADEVSMVNDKMAYDLLDTGVRILVLGDPEQLPPVRGEGMFVRERPDMMLTEIHRQAEGSPVLDLATRVRLGGSIEPEEYADGMAVDYASFDQILCWRRKTRWGAIRYVRKQLGRPAGIPVVGDRVMNLSNNKELSVFNGQVFEVLGSEKSKERDTWHLTVREDGTDGDSWEIEAFEAGFTEEGEKDADKARLGWRGTIAYMTFAQALTVHKAQGSEWKHVCVLDETRPMFDMAVERGDYFGAAQQTRRWLYTAVTRASEAVTLVRKS